MATVTGVRLQGCRHGRAGVDQGFGIQNAKNFGAHRI